MSTEPDLFNQCPNCGRRCTWCGIEPLGEDREGDANLIATMERTAANPALPGRQLVTVDRDDLRNLARLAREAIEPPPTTGGTSTP